MQYKNETIVITDPCYLDKFLAFPDIDEDTIYGDWSCLCVKGDLKRAEKVLEEWYKLDRDKEKEFIEKYCYGEFCADGGRVAVYRYDKLNDDAKKWLSEHDWCATIIPDYTGNVEYETFVNEKYGEMEARIVGDGFVTVQCGA